MIRKTFFWILIITSALLFLCPFASANQVVLEWTANSETDLDGYRVFYRKDGQAYDYANPAWDSIETTCTIYDLDDTTTYHFVARAYDTENFESGDSDEVTYIPPPVAEVDNIFIMSASYNTKKRTLSVKAVSDAPANSVTLTVWADFGFGSIELANLKYSNKKKIYSYTLRKLSTVPITVTITSTGGGYDEREL